MNANTDKCIYNFAASIAAFNFGFISIAALTAFNEGLGIDTEHRK
jgi:hypothetical protein